MNNKAKTPRNKSRCPKGSQPIQTLLDVKFENISQRPERKFKSSLNVLELETDSISSKKTNFSSRSAIIESLKETFGFNTHKSTHSAEKIDIHQEIKDLEDKINKRRAVKDELISSLNATCKEQNILLDEFLRLSQSYLIWNESLPSPKSVPDIFPISVSESIWKIRGQAKVEFDQKFY